MVSSPPFLVRMRKTPWLIPNRHITRNLALSALPCQKYPAGGWWQWCGICVCTPDMLSGLQACLAMTVVLQEKRSSDHSNDPYGTIIAFGIARRNMKCLTWSVHQARMMISGIYMRPCASRTPAPHPDRAICFFKDYKNTLA